MRSDRTEPPLLVVDTNLLVAHLFHPQSPGPATVMSRWRNGRVRVAVSGAVIEEVRATIRRLPVDAKAKQAILDLLEDPDASQLVDPVPDSGFRCVDPSDDKFLHLAVAASADAILSSDRALHEVAGFPIPVMKSGQWSRTSDR